MPSLQDHKKGAKKTLRDPYQPKHRKKLKSLRKLKKMDYDPIEELIYLYRELQEENQYWKDVRSGKLVQLNDKGNKKYYSSMAHTAVLGLMKQVGSDLLPYSYAKVPTDVNLNTNRVPEFNIYTGTPERAQSLIEHQSEEKEINPKFEPMSPKH